MPSFPTLCLSGGNKKFKASDVESLAESNWLHWAFSLTLVANLSDGRTAQNHCVAIYLAQPLQEMPSFPTLCLSGGNKKFKASDVESLGRNGCWSGSIGCIGPSFWLWWQIYQMEGCSKPLRFYASSTTTSGNAFLSDTLSFLVYRNNKKKASDVESLAEMVAGRGHQISRHFRWC